MNKKIELGLINTLEITRFTENGAYLKAQDEEELLLPNAYVLETMKEGDEVEAFVYTDSEDRLVATTIYPKAMLYDFAALEVVDIAPFGAFLDMGLPKDLLIPKSNQKTKFSIGDIKVVRVEIDDKTNRLVATERINKYFSTDTQDLRKNQKVKIFVLQQTDLGYKVYVDDLYEGLVFKNEIFQKIKIGDVLEAYIRNKRSDGKLDISLQPLGKSNVKNIASSSIETLLDENNGFLPYNYKSSPEDIMDIFSLSKKNFKATLTKLINEKKISLDEKGITKL